MAAASQTSVPMTWLLLCHLGYISVILKSTFLKQYKTLRTPTLTTSYHTNLQPNNMYVHTNAHTCALTHTHTHLQRSSWVKIKIK